MTENLPSVQRPIGSRNLYPAAEILSSRCSPEVAARRASILFAQFRRDDAINPEAFVASTVSILCEYPEQVAYAVTAPGGLPSQLKFVPSISEIRAACEAAVEPIRARMRRDELRKPPPSREPPSATERTRVVSGFRSLRDAIGDTKLEPPI